MLFDEEKDKVPLKSWIISRLKKMYAFPDLAARPKNDLMRSNPSSPPQIE